ncbi:hypothetical protein HMPREF1986_00431 [Oribacterium sp. oral taxon 078 str. F0263]|nr:hypothetical protein HMPREF1986_00431 [Oribacterium sp. oral taxon 078 str. F0263]
MIYYKSVDFSCADYYALSGGDPALKRESESLSAPESYILSCCISKFTERKGVTR